uniref:Uncharacterized protein n=1 Tax=Amphilophus citrinellus TaxID=61819 RepID=A0A3Q0SQI2_AMPCI
MYLYLLGLVVLYYLYRWVRELPRVSDKNNRYVYITGCDSGFGNLLAQHLDKQGFRVIASCFTERGEEELKKSCSSNLITTHLDVRSQDSIAKVANTLDRVYSNLKQLGDADLMKVVHCMEHAVAAVRRRTRYSPGWDAKLFRLPLSYMPTCVSDYILQMEAIPIAKQIE